MAFGKPLAKAVQGWMMCCLVHPHEELRPLLRVLVCVGDGANHHHTPRG